MSSITTVWKLVTGTGLLSLQVESRTNGKARGFLVFEDPGSGTLNILNATAWDWEDIVISELYRIKEDLERRHGVKGVWLE